MIEIAGMFIFGRRYFVIINGEEYNFDSITLSQIIENLSCNSGVIVAEVDGVIIPRDQFNTHVVDKLSVVELVAFVGGG